MLTLSELAEKETTKRSSLKGNRKKRHPDSEVSGEPNADEEQKNKKRRPKLIRIFWGLGSLLIRTMRRKLIGDQKLNTHQSKNVCMKRKKGRRAAHRRDRGWEGSGEILSMRRRWFYLLNGGKTWKRREVLKSISAIEPVG